MSAVIPLISCSSLPLLISLNLAHTLWRMDLPLEATVADRWVRLTALAHKLSTRVRPCHVTGWTEKVL